MKKQKFFIGLVIPVVNFLLTNSTFALTKSGSTEFTVSIPEEIVITVTAPSGAAEGSVNEFVRNKVSVDVSSNNPYGFSTTLKTKNSTTALVNTVDQSMTIPSLTDTVTQANFPTNYWGFSDDDAATVSATSTYYPLTASGTNLSAMSSSSATSLDDDIYFSVKVDGSKASGTYTNTVVVAVVGKISNGEAETDPTPVDDDDNPEVISDVTDTDGTRTIITETDYTDDTTQRNKVVESENAFDGTTTTENSTSSYATPQGANATTDSESVNTKSIIASFVALVSSIGFFWILVKTLRQRSAAEDDDDDE